MHDEVKLQKNGLLATLFTKIFQTDTLPFDRISMDALLIRIPELNDIFKKIKRISAFIPITINKQQGSVHLSILDHLKVSERRFIEFFSTYPSIDNVEIKQKTNITFEVKEPPTPWKCSPFYFHMTENYVLPSRKELYDSVHEVISHYLLLYNLSMICRYETEWWSELFYTFESEDLTFIQAFLEITASKVPILLYTFLNEKRM